MHLSSDPRSGIPHVRSDFLKIEKLIIISNKPGKSMSAMRSFTVSRFILILYSSRILQCNPRIPYAGFSWMARATISLACNVSFHTDLSNFNISSFSSKFRAPRHSLRENIFRLHIWIGFILQEPRLSQYATFERAKLLDGFW